MKNETDQEKFWKGDFGHDYITRNGSKELLASNINMFSKILSRTQDINSLIEFGCNIGMNLKAIELLLPSVDISGIEINKSACDIVKDGNQFTIYNKSIIDFCPVEKYDLALIKGVLIHINPKYLNNVYKNIYDASNRYICVAEYYNPTPVSINYRGHSDRLFKRDFAGELLDLYNDLKLVDYGFCYHRDPVHPKDDLTWFLLEKQHER